MERRVRIDLAYDGTAYAGWQVQPGLATVQGTLEGALGRLHGGAAVRARGAGRTDAGVHARGQAADAAVAVRADDAALLAALSGLLPDAIRPRRVLTVDPGFHARRRARAKTYRYLVDTSPHGDPWLARFALASPGAMDEGAVDEALAKLPGRRDWSGFTGAACEVTDRVRTMTEARRVVTRPGLVAFVFSADGFLTHMVRNLVGTLLDIGRGRFAPDLVDEVLASGDRTRAGATAPAKGLALLRVAYDDADGGDSGDPGDSGALW
ncbi:MAG TPA: tRNA pseudouridine(38-40) synthase TruA [Candidatus Polarisedimenticolaceae bacterium]|nr:tRNA pseudouridine(38-40) synthase TruA [Candidatus Polarisedimenticolaceae bacterium]